MKGVWSNAWGNGHTAAVPFDLVTKFALTDLGKIPGKGWGRVLHAGDFLVYPSVGHGQGMVYALSKDGVRKWKTPLERGKQFEFANPCIMVTDHCIVVVRQRFVDGLDGETGERKWRVEAPDDAPAYLRGAEPFKHGIQNRVDGRTVVIGGTHPQHVKEASAST